MSTTPAGPPGRGQPDWLRAKYARQPASPKLATWADRTIEILTAQRVPRHIGPYQDRGRALVSKNALYDAAYKRWNRTHPDDQISLSANVTDPKDGKCYARNVCRCEQNECKPSKPGTIAIHARVRSKAEGRTHQGAKPRDTWDYDPLAPGHGGRLRRGPRGGAASYESRSDLVSGYFGWNLMPPSKRMTSAFM